MTTSNIIKSIREVIVADGTLNSYINNRCYTRAPMQNIKATPLITLWLDDSKIIGNIPSGEYEVSIELYNSIDNPNCLEMLANMKDRVKALLNKNPSAINARGHSTKVHLFDLRSAVLSDEHLGIQKLWCMPCVFDCIIGD